MKLKKFSKLIIPILSLPIISASCFPFSDKENKPNTDNLYNKPSVPNKQTDNKKKNNQGVDKPENDKKEYEITYDKSMKQINTTFKNKHIPNSNRKVESYSAEIKQAWDDLINLYDNNLTDSNQVKNSKSILGVLENNLTLFKHNKIYLNHLTNWIDLQAKSANFKPKLDYNGKEIFDNQNMHYAYLFQKFLVKEDGFRNFTTYCLEYNLLTNKQNYSYIRNIIDETQAFLEIQYRNKDLAFDPTIDGYIYDINNLDFIKNAPNDNIKKLRLALLNEGGIYEAKSNKNGLVKYNEGKPVVYNDYFPNRKYNYQSFINAFPYNQEIYGDFLDKDRDIVPAWLNFNNTELVSQWGYFMSPASSAGYNKNYLYYLKNAFKLEKEPYANTLVYRHKREEWSKLKQYVIDTIPYLISSQFNEEQKLRALHNFITMRLKYDYNGANNEIMTGKINLDMRNPAVFSNNPDFDQEVLGVCETYARMLTLYATFLNLNVAYFTGDSYSYQYNEKTRSFIKRKGAEPHAWNIYQSKENGKYYYLDLTFDDMHENKKYTTPFNDHKVLPFTYRYFMKPWDEFARAHKNITSLYEMDSQIQFDKYGQSPYTRSVDKNIWAVYKWYEAISNLDHYFEVPNNFHYWK